jgi:hypothetical protein
VSSCAARAALVGAATLSCRNSLARDTTEQGKGRHRSASTGPLGFASRASSSAASSLEDTFRHSPTAHRTARRGMHEEEEDGSGDQTFLHTPSPLNENLDLSRRCHRSSACRCRRIQPRLPPGPSFSFLFPKQRRIHVLSRHLGASKLRLVSIAI